MVATRKEGTNGSHPFSGSSPRRGSVKSTPEKSKSISPESVAQGEDSVEEEKRPTEENKKLPNAGRPQQENQPNSTTAQEPTATVTMQPARPSAGFSAAALLRQRLAKIEAAKVATKSNLLANSVNK